MAKTSKVKKPNGSEIQYRALSVVPSTLDNEKRSVDAVLASETPVMEADYERMAMVPTVLLMSGCQIPKNKSIVMLDNHQRSGSVAQNIKGSANELRVAGTELMGRLDFSSLAKDEWTLASEGNLKDVSIGRTDQKEIWIPEGQTRRLDGRDFAGPMRVITSWTAKEVSLTPIGADPTAKLRQWQEELGADPDVEPAGLAKVGSALRSSAMEPLLKLYLVERGLPEASTDEQALSALHGFGMPKETEVDKVRSWVETNSKAITFAKPPVGTETENRAVPKVQPQVPVIDPVKAGDEMYSRFEQRMKERQANELKIRQHAETEGKRFGLDAAAIDIVARSESIELANRAILDAMATRQAPSFQVGNIGEITQYGAAQRDKHADAIRTGWTAGLLDRSIPSGPKKQAEIDKVLPTTNRQAGWERFVKATPMMIARECCDAMGIRTNGMSNIQIAQAAFGCRDLGGFAIRERSALHTTGSFPNVTLDAINKTMLAAYGAVETTYDIVFDRGSSVPDFKNKNVIKIGNTPNLDVWPEGQDIPEGMVKDEKESYAVEAYAKRFSITWRAVVNDDMDAFSKVPASHSRAAANTIEQTLWGIVLANPTLNDSVALFATATGNRKTTNLTASVGAPSVTTVQTLTALMRSMRGVNTPEEALPDDYAGARPRFIVGPPELMTTIAQLVNSVADPASSNAGVFNTARYLQPVIVDFLSSAAGSTTAWYLFADPILRPTIEYCFLQGQETPYITSGMDEDSWSMNIDVVQTFGGKAVDHRGAQKHNNA